MIKVLTMQFKNNERLLRKFFFLLVLLIPIVCHFVNLSWTIINYPNFGDDFVYIELIEYANQHSFIETFKYIFKLHNQVHLIVASKIFVLVNYLVTENLNFKTLTIVSNIQLLAILFIFYLYIRKKKYNKWHLIIISFLLFSPLTSIDNYSLLGSLTHTSSLLVLVVISYLVEFYRKSVWLILVVLLYPLVQTDGWLMLLIFCVISYFIHYPFRRLVYIIFTIYFSIYIYIQLQNSHSSLSFEQIKSIPLAFFVFLGNYVLPLTDSNRIVLNTLGGILIFGIIGYYAFKKAQITQLFNFPMLICLQIFAIAFLVCIGRGTNNDLITLVLGDRFYTYSIILLIANYLLLIPVIERFNFNFFIIVSILYYLGSSFYFIQIRSNLKSRLIADCTNAYFVNNCLSYSIKSDKLKSLMAAPFFQLDSSNLLFIKSQLISLKSKKSFKTKIEYHSNQKIFNLDEFVF